MLKGGKIQFAIIEISEYSSSSYSFDIENADGFENATKKLIE